MKYFTIKMDKSGWDFFFRQTWNTRYKIGQIAWWFGKYDGMSNLTEDYKNNMTVARVK